jgi:hypothetical protein
MYTIKYICLIAHGKFALSLFRGKKPEQGQGRFALLFCIVTVEAGQGI